MIMWELRSGNSKNNLTFRRLRWVFSHGQSGAMIGCHFEAQGGLLSRRFHSSANKSLGSQWGTARAGE